MTIIHLIRSLKYLEMEAYYCGAFAAHYWLKSLMKEHFYSNYIFLKKVRYPKHFFSGKIFCTYALSKRIVTHYVL